jgi:hypothetical protein
MLMAVAAEVGERIQIIASPCMKKHTAKSNPVPDLGHFLNFNLFLIIFKNNPWQTLFALGDPFGRARQRDAAASLCRATCSGAAEVPRWPAAARAPGVGPGLPRHPAWRGSAGSSGPARPPFFLLLPFFICPSSPASGAAAGGSRHTPNPAICGGDSVGN